MFDRIIDLALAKLKTSIVEPIVLQDEILLFNKVKSMKDTHSVSVSSC